jgi:hypothetical protein
MTIRMDEAEVIAALVGSGIFTLALIVGFVWLLYLLVRPRRRRRERKAAEVTPSEAEEMIELIARMEQRLEVLERLVVQDDRPQDRVLEAGDSPELRRTK